jgi:GGDEF domain-containing protein
MYPAFTASIKDYFSIRDLAFECGPGGFALVLPNIDVRRAVRLTEDLLKSLKSMISLYREPSPYLPLYMGISAVAGRSVPAARVIREATAALQKARTDQDSHIVAFNPDPAKYRLQAESKSAAGA